MLTGTSSVTYAAGDTLHLRMQAVGSGTTSLKFKIWKGSTEPSAWGLSGTDTTSALQSASGVGIWAYASASTTDVPITVSVDNFAAKASSVTPPPANVKPTAVIGSSANNLAVSFTGSGSSDSDGTVTDYAWNFGDGATSTATNPNHTYTTAGPYTVTLKVTDNGGLTDTATKTVTVTAAPPANGNLAADLFGRTAATGFGTADTGGAWTVAGSAANYSVGGGTGNIKIATAGSSPAAYLNSVSSTDSDVTVDVSLDKLPNGGGGYVAIVGRGTSTNAYRGKVKIAANGVLTLYVTKVVAGVETNVLTGSSTVTYAAGDTLHLRMQAVGSGTTSLKFKIWKGSTEPTPWGLSGTDTTSALQSASGVGIWTYASGTTTVVPITVSLDNFAVKPTN